MKILQIHNFYDRKSPSGENMVVNMERELLRNAGYQVDSLYVYSDSFKTLVFPHKIKASSNWLGLGINTSSFKATIDNYAPDLVHIHNTFPLLGIDLFEAVKGLPSVFTVHNYRLSCVNGLHLKKGKICDSCNGSTFNIVKPTISKCYGNSYFQSLFASAGLSRLRTKGYINTISHFIALTNFQKKYLCQFGIAEDNISIKPNAYDKNYINKYSVRSKEVIFVGRLSQEKGILELLHIWKTLNLTGWTLKVIGSGPLDEAVNMYKDDPSINILGKMSHDNAICEIQSASFIVVPSLWYEGYPMVIREAISNGIPCLVSEIGSTREAVDHTVAMTFNPNDFDDFSCKLLTMMTNESLRNTLSSQTEMFFNKFFEKTNNIKCLELIYKQTINA